MTKQHRKFSILNLRNIAFVCALFMFSTLGVQAQTSFELDSFFVDPSFDRYSRTQIHAFKIRTSDNAYFYIERNYWNSLATAEQTGVENHIATLATEFENNIYSKITNFLGSIANPGNDNDSRMYIVLMPQFENIGGYFNTLDSFERSLGPDYANSNQIEVVYLNTDYLGTNQINGFLAHEFQHLISVNQKELRIAKTDDIWLNEARSEYMPTYLGYDTSLSSGTNIGNRVKNFKSDYQDSLVEWTGQPSDYAAVSMFVQYVTGRFSSQVIPRTLQSVKTGIDSLMESLKQGSYHGSFAEVFEDWMIASLLNDSTLGSGQYSYANPLLRNFTVQPQSSSQLFKQSMASRSSFLSEYEPMVHEFSRTANDPTSLTVSAKSQGLNSGKIHLVGLVRQVGGSYSVIDGADDGTGVHSFTVEDFGTNVRKVISLVYIEKPTRSYLDEILPTHNTTITGSTHPVSAVVQDSEVPDPIVIVSTPVSSTFIERLDHETIFNAPDQQVVLSGAFLNEVDRVFLGDVEAQIVGQDSFSLTLRKSNLPTGSHSISYAIGDERFSTSLSITSVDPQPDGALVRAEGTPEVYIVKGGFIRHIQTPKIFDFYGHLGFDIVRVISPDELSLYTESKLIMRAGDDRVFELTPDGTKLWVNMTPEQFRSRGRRFGAIYIVNLLEFNYYREGASITI